jgi:hypothetical protein
MNGGAKPDLGFQGNADPDLRLSLFQGQEKSRTFGLGLRDKCFGSGFNQVSDPDPNLESGF